MARERGRTNLTTAGRFVWLSVLLSSAHPGALRGQDSPRLFPDRALIPILYAGPRDPVAKGEVVLVTDNPNAFGDGVEMELAVGSVLPVWRFAGSSPSDAVVVGLEGAVFARFGLQVLERELIATDWVFAVPVVWHRRSHWLRVRYFHTSSHLGDEYARRFDAEGVNFARDAADGLGFVQLVPAVGAYAGVRWSYNVHPNDAGRWTLRAGTQLGRTAGASALLPYGALDVEVEQDTDWKPLVHVQVGVWLPQAGGRRALRFGAAVLTGPSPLGQFRTERTTQITLGVSGNL